MARLQDPAPAAATPHPNPPAAQGLWISAVLACALPSLLAFNVSPSPTFLNQALAFVLWAAFVLASANAWRHRSAPGKPAAMAVLVLIAGAAVWSWLARGLPASLALSAIFTLVAVALVLAALVFAVVPTASRAGLVSVVLLALWGLAEQRSRRVAAYSTGACTHPTPAASAAARKGSSCVATGSCRRRASSR